MEIPEGWKAETVREGLSHGLYGLSLEPAEGVSGRVIALHTDCSSWEERHWKEAMSILNTVNFVPAGEEE